MFDLVVVLAQLGEAFGVSFYSDRSEGGGVSVDWTGFSRRFKARTCWSSWTLPASDTAVRIVSAQTPLAAALHGALGVLNLISLLRCDDPSTASCWGGTTPDALPSDWDPYGDLLGNDMLARVYEIVPFETLASMDIERATFSFACGGKGKRTWPVAMILAFERLVQERKAVLRARMGDGMSPAAQRLLPRMYYQTHGER